MNGYLKIKTKIDNSDIDKEIQQLEDKIKKLQTDNADLSQKQDSLQSEIDQYDELCKQADKYNEKLKDLEAQKDSLSVNGSIKNSQLPQYNLITSQIEQSRAEQIKLNNEIGRQSSKVKNVYGELEKIKNKQTENNAKITEFKSKIDQIKMQNVRNDVEDVGKSISNQIGKIGKMAMAVVGVRTAFTAVTRVVNLVKQYNSQVATDFEYMGFCIANVVAPAVQKLVQLLYTLLSYINAITTAWFGINLFSNSSVKAFQKMQNSAASTAKSAKEIQKSLAGFDEMNVLSDNSVSDTGTSGGSRSYAKHGFEWNARRCSSLVAMDNRQQRFDTFFTCGCCSWNSSNKIRIRWN